MARKKIVIIGAGLSGLSSAALLAKQGFAVTVLDKLQTPGGVARSFSDQGFTFDGGPSWYLMPEVFERFFADFGRSPADFYDLVPLDPSYQVFFGANDSLIITRDRDNTCQLFEGLEKGAGKKIDEYLQDARYKYETAMEEFLYREYRSLFDFFNKRTMVEGAKLSLFQSLDKHIRRSFTHKKIQKILGYNVVFIGCSPFKSPALYSLMSHVDITIGVFYPKGGIVRLVEAIYKVAKDHGAEFLFGEEAKAVTIAGGRATGVKTDNGMIDADGVLAAVDYHHAEQDLIPPPYRRYSPSYWRKRVLAPSALLIYLGLNKKISGLEHHNLFLSDHWERHFTAIFDKPAWPENPSYYIGCSSKTDPTGAPSNGENLFVLVPLAPGLDDNEHIREGFVEKIINHLEGLLGVKITDAVVVKHIVAQRDFNQSYNLYKGTAMGLAHTLLQSALFRPSHRSKKVSNLYFSSHYTHPGIGMPMVIISSHIVADIIGSDFS
ncbi:MAG: phytoene desaturase [Deltaproteobacteria bacterium]|nr:phytoene desaturase [Deltaproteobacteria bacterium]